MRVLRFLRPARSTATARDVNGPGEALGLDAFATEAPPPSGETAGGHAEIGRLRTAVAALAVLVALQAIPAFLWLQARLAPVEASASTAPAAATAASLPSGAEAAPPCAPAPAPEPAGGAGAAGAAAAAGAPARAAAPAMVAGLVSFDTPVPMNVYSDERLIGTTEVDTLMLAVGTHHLELVSDAVGFRAERSVTVQAGRTTSVRIDAPRVPVHVNAVPWAEVWIDNQRIGETPIGNLQQTVGPHEFIFRHPELGERRMIVLVTMKEPARVSMDLRKK